MPRAAATHSLTLFYVFLKGYIIYTLFLAVGPRQEVEMNCHFCGKAFSVVMQKNAQREPRPSPARYFRGLRAKNLVRRSEDLRGYERRVVSVSGPIPFLRAMDPLNAPVETN